MNYYGRYYRSKRAQVLSHLDEVAVSDCEYDVAFSRTPSNGSGGSAQAGSTSLTTGGAGKSTSSTVPGGASSACPLSSLQPGDNDGALQVGNVTRTYTVHLPANYSGTTSVPLVLDFHGLGADSAEEAAGSGYRELSEQQGFIVAWLQGIENTWNIGPCCTTSRTVDDAGFARALVQKLQKDACVDQKRIYAVGYVMGGGMALYLACNAADVFAGVAASGFDLFQPSEEPCQPVRPITEISFRGTADSVIPYDGGLGSPPNGSNVVVTFIGAIATFQRFAALNQCVGSPSTADSNGCSTYSQCQDKVDVTLCTTDGGEDWGSPQIAWNTLKAHSLP